MAEQIPVQDGTAQFEAGASVVSLEITKKLYIGSGVFIQYDANTVRIAPPPGKGLTTTTLKSFLDSANGTLTLRGPDTEDWVDFETSQHTHAALRFLNPLVVSGGFAVTRVYNVRFEVPRSIWVWFLESLSTDLEKALIEKSSVHPTYDKSKLRVRGLRLSSPDPKKLVEVKRRVQSRLTARDSAHGIAPLTTHEAQHNSCAPCWSGPNNGTAERIKGQVPSQSADRQEHKVLLSRQGVARSDITFPSTDHITNADSVGHSYGIRLSGGA